MINKYLFKLKLKLNSFKNFRSFEPFCIKHLKKLFSAENVGAISQNQLIAERIFELKTKLCEVENQEIPKNIYCQKAMFKFQKSM